MNQLIARPTKNIKQPTRVVVCELGIKDPVRAIVGQSLNSSHHVWIATVNFDDLPPNEGCVWINDNGRNRGLKDELERLGVIKFNDRFASAKSVGYVFECKVLI